eukprot:703784-Rhodomonas_salina.2
MEVMGYEAEGAAVLVRAGESVNVAVQAVRVGGAVWLSAGTYTESVRVTKPCSVVALAEEAPTIVAPDPSQAALIVEGIDSGVALSSRKPHSPVLFSRVR